MNSIKSIFYLALFAGMLLVSCVEDERVTFLGGTAPVLTASSTDDLVLAKATENYTSLQFQWTNPDYEFSNGVNTQDVYYTLQVDTAGSNFSNPKISELSFTRDISHTFTVSELNNFLSGLELKDFVPHEFEFRIKATLASGSVPLYSDVVSITITTYLDVVYPVPANLYITGAATPKSWMGGGDPEEVTQKFTKTNAYTFVLDGLALNAAQGFLFVPVYGNWDNKYGFTGEKEKNNASGDKFKPNGNDFISPAKAATYKITVNFKTGKYSMEEKK